MAPDTERANRKQRARRQRPPGPPPCWMDLPRDPLEIIPFAEEERILTAKVPASHNRNCFSKSECEIDLDQMEVRCRRVRASIAPPEKVEGANLFFPRPVVRPVPCARNASVGKGRGVLVSKPKNDCSNRPAPITRPRRGGRACASGWWWNIGLRAWWD